MVGYKRTEREHPMLYKKFSIILAHGKHYGRLYIVLDAKPVCSVGDAVQKMAYVHMNGRRREVENSRLAPSFLTTV